MPPEIASPPPSWSPQDALGSFSRAWRNPLAVLGLSAMALGVLTMREWGEMFHQWWNIDTYNHILLVPAIIVWLVWLRRAELCKASPQSWVPGLVLVAAGLGLWLIGRASGINFIAHAGAVGAAQGAVVAVLGLRVSLLLALPLTFAAFLVPFGDELIPVLQTITAEIAVTLTHWSGIPALIDGIHIDTPVGLFIVAEACSGVKFLVATVTLAVLVCFTRFSRWSHRAIFMAISIIVPILANGVRAWGTIYIAQFRGVEFAAGFDHIFYGWIFFALVVAVLIGLAWRFFDREPDEQGWSTAELAAWSWLTAAEARIVSTSATGGAIAALVVAGALLAAIVAPAAMV